MPAKQTQKAAKQLKKPVILLIGIAIGFLVFAGLRAALIEDNSTHYHANFGLFINGQRESFELPTYYEEVTSCSDDHVHDNPAHRVHMHDNVNHVVHVHDDMVTWGHFLANLGFGLSDRAVTTHQGVFADDEDGQLKFILNGEEVRGVANRIIESEDVLLISYGSDDDLDIQYKQIPRDAAKFNQADDPSGCAGDEDLNLIERVRQAFDFTQ